MPASYISINNEFVPDPLLAEVTVSQRLNEHTSCRVVIRSTPDKPIQIDQIIGKDLKISTVDHAGEEITVFEGFILETELEYEITGSFTAVIHAVSLSYKLEVTPQNRYFLAKPLSAIASALGGDDGLAVELSCADRKPLNYVQYGESDFNFLRRMADDHAAWIRPTADGILISDHFQPGCELEWRTEFGLQSFRTRARLASPSFNGHHYDHHEMKSAAFTAVSDDPDFFGGVDGLVDAVKQQSNERIPPGYVDQRSRAKSTGDFEDRLKHEAARSMGAAVSAFGVSLEPRLKPGDTVDITGPIAAAGTYGLIAVTHVWSTNGYSNEFECTPWKSYRSELPPRVRESAGLVPARVVEHNDPKKMGRIKVRYFWQEDGDGHWARCMTPHAGGGRGFMFMPEVGDEVVVGFEDGDPERPVVLGCVWNGVDQAPRQKFYADKVDMDSNWVKRIVTKSGNRIQIVDKPGHEAIVLSTPNSARVTLIENAAETGRTMLSLYSTGDILLAAPNGRVHIQAAYFSQEVGNG